MSFHVHKSFDNALLILKIFGQKRIRPMKIFVKCGGPIDHSNPYISFFRESINGDHINILHTLLSTRPCTQELLK